METLSWRLRAVVLLLLALALWVIGLGAGSAGLLRVGDGEGVAWSNLNTSACWEYRGGWALAERGAIRYSSVTEPNQCYECVSGSTKLEGSI